jgi:hypothetical protein
VNNTLANAVDKQSGSLIAAVTSYDGNIRALVQSGCRNHIGRRGPSLRSILADTPSGESGD